MSFDPLPPLPSASSSALETPFSFSPLETSTPPPLSRTVTADNRTDVEDEYLQFSGLQTPGAASRPHGSPRRRKTPRQPETSTKKIYHSKLNGETHKILILAQFTNKQLPENIALPCNEEGEYLLGGDREKPPPYSVRTSDDWTPFTGPTQFKMAEFLFCKTKMSASDIDTLMGLWEAGHGGEQLFSDHEDLYNTIDSTDLGDLPWQKSSLHYKGALPSGEVPEWMTAQYDIFYRDPREVVKNILDNPTFDGAFDYVPYQDFDHNGDRRYENLMSGDWAFKQAVSLLLLFLILSQVTHMPTIRI